MIEKRNLFALPLALAAACGDDNPVPDDPDSGSEPGPAYLVGTRVWDDASTTSYFNIVPSIEAGAVVDPAVALEVPGAAKVFAIPDAGWFAIGGGDAPTITRYTLDENDRFVRGDTISMQDHGVQSLWDTLYVVSSTKVYYPDRDGRQLIVWNPTAMEITGSIPLPTTAREGYLSLYGYTPLLRGDELLFTIGWFDWTNDRILGETGLVVIDTAMDAVARVDVDTRCGGITTGVVTASRAAYFVSSALAGAAHRLDRIPTAPCALRIAAGADAFDAAYLGDMRAVAGGAIAGEPVPGGGDTMFLRVFDEQLATVNADDATWELTGQAAWRWLRWDAGAPAASPVTALDPGTADVLWFEIDDRVFGSQTTADYSQTTLVELTAAGGPKPALTAPGFLHGVARVR